jgi:putative ABC transport system permease protein
MLSLLQHKLRSVLSILGVVCGVMAVLSMLSVGEGARKVTIRQIERLGAKNIYFKAMSFTEDQTVKAREKLSQGLTTKDMDRIKSGSRLVSGVAGLKEITAATLGFEQEITPQVVACSSNLVQLQNIPVSKGRFITDDDLYKGNLVCVVGAAIASQPGQKLKVGDFIRVGEHLLKVVGILGRLSMDQPDSAAITVRNYNEMIFIPLGTEDWVRQPSFIRDEQFGMGLSEIIVQIDKTDKVLAAVPVLERIMSVSHKGVTDYQMIIPQELLRQSRQTQRNFNIVIGAIAGISLLVGGIGIMNVMLASVSERTGEIGIRRAVGASRLHITYQFLMESVILTLSGGVIGILAGNGSVWMITTLAGWETAVTPYAVVVPLLMSIFIGIFFGIYPAYKAAMLDPIIALRRE